MKILLKFAKKLRRFNSYKIRDRLLIVKVFLLTGVFRMAMLYIPFKKLKNHMGEVNKESSDELSRDKYNEAARILWAIEKAVKYTPWESKCLVQSLTAQYLLYHKRIESTLYLGISRESNVQLNISEKADKNVKDKQSDFIAHSWIRCGRLFVTGGNGENFAVVAKFRKGF